MSIGYHFLSVNDVPFGCISIFELSSQDGICGLGPVGDLVASVGVREPLYYELVGGPIAPGFISSEVFVGPECGERVRPR